MESIIEGLLYVQGDLGLTLNQIEDILEIDEEKAKELVLNLKNYYVENNRGLRINFLGNNIKVGCHFFFQIIFPTQGSNPCLLHQIIYSIGKM